MKKKLRNTFTPIAQILLSFHVLSTDDFPFHFSQDIWREMFEMRRSTFTTRNGDAGTTTRFPPALLRMRRVLSTITKGGAVRPARRTALLQAGLRKGNVPHATS